MKLFHYLLLFPLTLTFLACESSTKDGPKHDADSSAEGDALAEGDGKNGTEDHGDGKAGDSENDSEDEEDGNTAPSSSYVVINEVAPAGEPRDWVELHNLGDESIDISGWHLKDDNDEHDYVFPAMALIPAKGYKLIQEAKKEDEEGFEFGLGSSDMVRLYDQNMNLLDETEWEDGDAPSETSWGRIPNGEGGFQTLLSPTPGEANVENPATSCGDGLKEGLERCDGEDFGGLSCEALGWGGGTLLCKEGCTRIDQSACEARSPGLVINEVESENNDRIELYNGSDEDLSLEGYQILDQQNNAYIFPSGSFIEKATYLVLSKGEDHSFGIGSTDGLRLLSPLGEPIDACSWADKEAIPSWCRLPSGVGGFQSCNEKTFGGPNL